MVWGCFNSHGKARLAFVTPRMNSEFYQDVLDACLVPFLEENDDGRMVFMHDNASIHASNSTRRWLADRNIPVFQHPPRSPDLNPIENVWGILARRVYANNKQYRNVAELKKAIQAEWDGLEQEHIDSLVESMQNRVFEVIQRGGGPTHY